METCRRRPYRTAVLSISVTALLLLSGISSAARAQARFQVVARSGDMLPGFNEPLK
jgi:hypothetical protein